ncbi:MULTISPECIES: hypothetical protein [unclassified Variovorax]|uniref:hypothetical protein n=1 Tax=unclassified Variovorax TaxID=663243 RepID=UPI000F7F6BF1|nr:MULTISPECIES: hypothetical protein [unclassified Variovorax]RSZ43906.1 hypothetical protein EJO70_08145 [Variovorax sp. 553]RSZ45440.1 hypothetical protein EJO71_09700 [Variovorax sp. 679]
MPTSNTTDRSAFFNWISAGMLMGGLALPLVAKAVEPGLWSLPLYSLSLLCWLALPLWYPYSVVKTGVIGAKYKVFRQQEPYRFWLGLATYEVLLLALGTVIALPVYVGLVKSQIPQ